jgi:hypothetical protein
VLAGVQLWATRRWSTSLQTPVLLCCSPAGGLACGGWCWPVVGHQRDCCRGGRHPSLAVGAPWPPVHAGWWRTSGIQRWSRATGFSAPGRAGGWRGPGLTGLSAPHHGRSCRSAPAWKRHGMVAPPIPDSRCRPLCLGIYPAWLLALGWRWWCSLHHFPS